MPADPAARAAEAAPLALAAVAADSFASQVVEASADQPVLVDFWGPRCGPCLKMMPWVERLAAHLAPALRVVKVNATEERRLSASLRVMGLPTYLLYRDGREVERLSGGQCTPSAILEMLRRHLPDADLESLAA